MFGRKFKLLWKKAFSRSHHQAGQILNLNQATVAPICYQINDEGTIGSKYAFSGVYSRTGQPIETSFLYRHSKFLDSAGSFAPAKWDNRKVIYCGRWFDYYGHFLLESLARLWCVEDYPEHCLCWSVPQGSDATPSGWQRDLVSLLCGDREIVLVSEPTAFDEVIVASAGFAIPDRFDSIHVDFLKRHAIGYDPEPGRWIWLSRSRFDTNSGMLNSKVLEKHLSRAGWHMIFPETLTIKEQIATLARAERVAGEEGSAFHLVLLLSGADQLRVDILPRRTIAKKTKPTYWLIAKKIGFKQHIHDVTQEKIVDRNRRPVTRIAPDFAPHLTALGIPVPDYALALNENADTIGKTDAVNKLSADLKATEKYLQVGYSDHINFLAVNATKKTLVSAEAKIDPRLLTRSPHNLFEMPFDLYREHFLNGQDRFELTVICEEFAHQASAEWLEQIEAISDHVVLVSDL